MNQYEVMYVIDTALEEQARTDLINRFSGLVEANGGQVDASMSGESAVWPTPSTTRRKATMC